MCTSYQVQDLSQYLMAPVTHGTAFNTSGKTIKGNGFSTVCMSENNLPSLS